jgi:nucleoside 2-deoxyribosyltransferase
MMMPSNDSTLSTLYLAGPMRGKPQFNFPLFDSVAATLRGKGFTVISPAELDDPDTRRLALNSPDGEAGEFFNGQTFGDFLGRDIKEVLDNADGVALLPGWRQSTGACIEAYAANKQGKPLYEVQIAKEGFMGLEELLPEGSMYREFLQNAATPGYVNGEYDNTPAFQVAIDYGRGGGEMRYVADPYEPFQPGEDRVLYSDGMPGEVRVTSDTGGEKGRKQERMDLIPPEPLWELARVYGFGATKYDDHNYLKGYDYSLSFGALLRHVTQWMNGEDNDSESGLHHLAHAAWHCFALMMYQAHGLGTDDRLPAATGIAPRTITRTGRSEAARK